MPENDPNELLTAREAAKDLKVTVQTVHRWALDGRLPEAKKLEGVRGARLFRRGDVDALVAEASA